MRPAGRLRQARLGPPQYQQRGVPAAEKREQSDIDLTGMSPAHDFMTQIKRACGLSFGYGLCHQLSIFDGYDAPLP